MVTQVSIFGSTVYLQMYPLANLQNHKIHVIQRSNLNAYIFCKIIQFIFKSIVNIIMFIDILLLLIFVVIDILIIILNYFRFL